MHFSTHFQHTFSKEGSAFSVFFFLRMRDVFRVIPACVLACRCNSERLFSITTTCFLLTTTRRAAGVERPPLSETDAPPDAPPPDAPVFSRKTNYSGQRGSRLLTRSVLQFRAPSTSTTTTTTTTTRRTAGVERRPLSETDAPP